MQGVGAEFTWKCKVGTQRGIGIFETLFVELSECFALGDVDFNTHLTAKCILKMHLVHLNHIEDSMSIFSND